MHGFSLAQTFPFKTKEDARTVKIDANKFADSVDKYIDEFMRTEINNRKSKSNRKLEAITSVDPINAKLNYIVRLNPITTKEFPFGLELGTIFTSKHSADRFADSVSGYIGNYIQSEAKQKLNKTERLLKSFSSVNLLDEHMNYGDQFPSLREFGFAPSIATALIRWGENHSLVCTFENVRGRTSGAYSWQPKFLKAAIDKHLDFLSSLRIGSMTLFADISKDKNKQSHRKPIQIHASKLHLSSGFQYIEAIAWR